MENKPVIIISLILMILLPACGKDNQESKSIDKVTINEYAKKADSLFLQFNFSKADSLYKEVLEVY